MSELLPSHDTTQIKSSIKIQALFRGYSFRHKNVLEPYNIQDIGINEKKLVDFITKGYLTPIRIEYIKSSKTKNIKLDDVFMEYILSKCIDCGEHVGAGNCPIDVYAPEKKLGLDVACLCLNGKITNEKSLTQNFNASAHELEELFKQNRCEEAIHLYRKIWHQKLCEAQKKFNVRELLYLCFISTDQTIYMSAFKINVKAVINIKSTGFTNQEKSIKIENIIDDKYGSTKLYKNKKRMELRFINTVLDCACTNKIYSFDSNNTL